MSLDDSKLAARLELLEEYHAQLSKYFRSSTEAERTHLKTYLNRNLIAVRAAVIEAGTLQHVTVSPPPAVGGVVGRQLDPFSNLFISFWGTSLIPAALDSIEQAIGVYEHLSRDTGLLHLPSRQTIEIEAAIERALRPSFRRSPPSQERDVQDAVEVILQSLGVQYSREKEVATVGERAFVPDFSVNDEDLAIEVKYAREGRALSSLQEELAADIAAFLTRWSRLLVVVYDHGVIADPYTFRRSHMTHFGVTVVVVKH